MTRSGPVSAPRRRDRARSAPGPGRTSAGARRSPGSRGRQRPRRRTPKVQSHPPIRPAIATAWPASTTVPSAASSTSDWWPAVCPGVGSSRNPRRDLDLAVQDLVRQARRIDPLRHGVVGLVHLGPFGSLDEDRHSRRDPRRLAAVVEVQVTVRHTGDVGERDAVRCERVLRSPSPAARTSTRPLRCRNRPRCRRGRRRPDARRRARRTATTRRRSSSCSSGVSRSSETRNGMTRTSGTGLL